MSALAAEDPEPLPSAMRMDELLHDAIDRFGRGESGEGPVLGRRSTRWRILLRRALHMAAASYRRLLAPQPLAHPELEEELRALGVEALAQDAGGPDLRSCVAMAETIAETQSDGLRSILVMSPAAGLALALGRLTNQRIALAPGEDADVDGLLEAGKRLGIDLLLSEPLRFGGELPFWLKRRFQAVVVTPPVDALGSHRSMDLALEALAPSAGRRLYWIGHPERQLDYFGLYSQLGGQGYLMERLFWDVASSRLDEEFSHQLLSDLLDTPEVAEVLDPQILGDLFAGGSQHEHLHLFRPAEEVVIQGHELDLVPLQAEDVARFDGWLTPEYSKAIGFDEYRPRPTVEELRLENWYPNNEWWVARTKDGRPVGLSGLVLWEFWTKRSLPFDVGIADPEFQGKGLLNELVRLSFYRVFEQLGANSLWANVELSNTRICRGYRSNFFEPVRRFVEAGSEGELEHIRIDAERYRERRRSGEINVPAGP